MENASKALIIAGAILVSIMIIGLGVVILRNVSDTINGAGVDKEAADANNQQYEATFGENVSASVVKNLASSVKTNNIIAENEKDGLGVIYLTLDGKRLDPTTLSKQVKNGKRYSVQAANDKSLKESDFINSNEFPDNYSEGDIQCRGYYYNGFLRTIAITTNTGSAS